MKTWRVGSQYTLCNARNARGGGEKSKNKFTLHSGERAEEEEKKQADKNITILTLNFKCYQIIFHPKWVRSIFHCFVCESLVLQANWTMCASPYMKSRWSFHINCITFVMRPLFRSLCTLKFMLANEGYMSNFVDATEIEKRQGFENAMLSKARG